MNKHFLPVLLGLLFSVGITAQDTLKSDSLDIYEMSLEQLMNLKAHGVPSELETLINELISAASKKPLSTRESPNIISLITAEEIRNSGARDLMDVLLLVPGIQFGMDVEGVVGISMRGNWGHEGKVLVLLDGFEMNEIMFATTQFGNNYPVDQIKKIEIIRGPGSAMFGGFAEYGVINIVTRSGGDIAGMGASINAGIMGSKFGRSNFNIYAGNKTGDLEWKVAGYFGNGHRSTSAYTDIFGNTYPMYGNSDLTPGNLQAGVSYKGWSLRFMADRLRTSVRDGYDLAQDSAYREDFISRFGELKYERKFSEKISFTGKITHKTQIPWRTTAEDSLTSAYNKHCSRSALHLLGSWNPTRKINISAGGEVYTDSAQDKTDSSFFSNGSSAVSYLNQAYFFQGLVRTRFVNLILGARYDIHSEYGAAFVPRVGLTKRLGKFNFKLLYSNSFRAPSIENINLGPEGGILPEMTTITEFELGYQIKKQHLLTLNFFDIYTLDPIIYFYDDSLGTDNYMNDSSSTGTMGAEAEYRFKNKYGHITVSYSMYTAKGKGRAADFNVEEDESYLLSFARHKLALNASVELTSRLTADLSGVFLGQRYGYTEVDSLGESVLSVFDPSLNIHLNLRYRIGDGIFVSAGCYDLLNSGMLFIQPYNGYHAPLPGPGREFIFRFNMDIGGKNKAK
ncbi:MAG: TonB-dependent receptor [Bacteroidia bacterium]|nr:TonB-dependent receptor [Bacteroidia bacterium]